ncbi:hypothetical protein C8R43DRAFT_1243586 [Mycena crocata]|nr:hypothetical protein C8R43DRAFT_1243586 [Mycena crocata]
MAFSPRTLAIIFLTVFERILTPRSAVAFFFDLAALCIVIVSLITQPSHRSEWYYIVMPIILSIGAAGAAFNSWRWWKVHTSQIQAFIPLLGGSHA